MVASSSMGGNPVMCRTYEKTWDSTIRHNVQYSTVMYKTTEI